MARDNPTPTRPRLKPLLLPAEHGGWGLIGGPVLLGLAVAPSGAGVWAALAAVAAFLARQPLKIAAKDLLQGKRFPRTRWAGGFAAGLLAVMTCGLIVAAQRADAPLGAPIAVLLALSAGQFAFDAMGQGRRTLPEGLGACAGATFAPLTALAGGVPAPGAWLLGGVLALHGFLAIVYVSARLGLARGEAPSLAAVGALALAATALAGLVVLLGWARWPLAAAFAVLACRALWGVSRRRATVPPKIVGFQEIGYTLGLVGVVAFGAGIATGG